MKREIAEILKREGFIRDAEYIEDNKQGIIRIFLKYGPNNERVITGLKRISKPGLRVYVKATKFRVFCVAWASLFCPLPKGL